MGNEKYLFSQFLDWLFHPYNSDTGTVKSWFAFLVLILIVSFLWSTVIHQEIE